MSLANVKTRQQAIDLLQGYTAERKEDIDRKKTRRPLVKSYLLETVSHNRQSSPLTEIFEKAGQRLNQLDETFYTVYDTAKDKTIGLLELVRPRYPVIYSHEDASELDTWARQLVYSTPDLDHLWISGRAFEEILNAITTYGAGYRFCRLVFEHTTLFETNELDELAARGLVGAEQQQLVDDEPGEVDDDASEDDDVIYRDIRSTRFSLTERLDVIKQILPSMRGIYPPLHALSQLRFPARGSGGHDFYYYGKATNRSASFNDHRQHVEYVINLYQRTTERIEQTAWQGVETTRIAKDAKGGYLVGAPVLLKFSEPLSQGVFNKFIDATFKKKHNKFRLWGNPIPMGPRKIHVYALDRHLWQPLFLEITNKQIMVMLAHGTCGNTIHRLITNVQHYLDPNVDVWVGNHRYADLIRVEPNDNDREIYGKD